MKPNLNPFAFSFIFFLFPLVFRNERFLFNLKEVGITSCTSPFGTLLLYFGVLP